MHRRLLSQAGGKHRPEGYGDIGTLCEDTAEPTHWILATFSSCSLPPAWLCISFCLCVSLRPSHMFRYGSSLTESEIHPRTDVTIHAKSAQLDKEIAAQNTPNGHLRDPPGEQNESRSHLGARRAPMPPTKVTRRCHSLRSQAVLCSFLDALLSQSTPKVIPMVNKIGKAHIGPGQQTSFGKCWECEGILPSQHPGKMDSVREWRQFAHSCKSPDK